MDTQIRPQRKIILVLWLLGIAFAALVCTVVVLILLRQSLTMKQSVQHAPPISAEPLHLLHAVFGEAHKTVAVDEGSPPVGGLSVWDQIKYNLGLGAPPSPPPAATRANLLIGQTPMWWSAGGYLYSDLLSSSQQLWQFAPCNKTNLSEVMPQDFLTTFVSMGDKTNGPAAFGTNWLKHGIRVRQGQIILARLVSDPAQVYALEITEQEMTKAVVYYFKKPL